MQRGVEKKRVFFDGRKKAPPHPVRSDGAGAYRVRGDITPAEAREILSKCEGVRVVDDPLNGGYPMPLDATAKYDVLAGRIRQDISRDDKKGLEMFVSGDQLLRGAALNAVEIAEHLVKRGLV